MDHLSETRAILVLLGAFLGFLYVSFSWRGKPASQMEFKDDPRVRGLIWGLSGAIMIVIADWEKFLQIGTSGTQDYISRGRLLGYYAAGFIGSAILTIVGLTIKVSLDSRRIAKDYPGIFYNEGMSPFVDFILYGYNDYQEKVARLVSRFRDNARMTVTSEAIDSLKVRMEEYEAEIERLALSANQRRRLTIEMGDIIQSAMNVYHGYTAGRMSAHDACQALLRSTITITAYYSGVDTGQLNANYMVVEEREALSATEIAATRFTFDDTSRYRQFLCLKQYAKKGTPTIRLPIEPSDDHDWKDRTLPGAPEAFLRRSPVICKAADTFFSKDLPESVRRAQQKYFATQPFDVILALPIVPLLVYNKDTTPIGVVNIDLSLNGDAQDVEVDLEVLEALVSPCNALLAEILAIESKQSRR